MQVHNSDKHYRRSTRKGADRRAFRNTVDRTHIMNVKSRPKRGGIRL